VLVLLAIGLWELLVRINHVPDYIIPAPSVVLRTLLENWDSLFAALLFTLKLTFLSLALAVVGGVLLAMLFAMSRWVEISLFPFAVILQVTPVIAIAPLILIYCDSTFFGIADLRLDRGLLSDLVEYRDRLAQRRPQSVRSVFSVPRHAVAAPALSVDSERATLLSGRSQSGRRPGPDRCRGGGIHRRRCRS